MRSCPYLWTGLLGHFQDYLQILKPLYPILMKQKLLRASLLIACLAQGVFLSAQAPPVGLILSEDFENGMGNWNLGKGGSLGVGIGNYGNPGFPNLPGNAGVHNGSKGVHLWKGDSFSVVATDEHPLLFVVDLYYSGSDSQRNSVVLGTGWGQQYEIGFEKTGNRKGLFMDASSFNGKPGKSEKVQLVSYRDLGTGNENAQWLTTETTFTGSEFIVNVYEQDRTLLASYSVEATSSNGFSELQFGHPLKTGGPDGGHSRVDNIRLEVIPEPSTYAAVFGGLALVRTLVYRRRVGAKK